MKKAFTFVLAIALSAISIAQSLSLLTPSQVEDQTAKRGVNAQRFIFQNVNANTEHTILLSPQNTFSCFGMAWDLAANPPSKEALNFKYRTLAPDGSWTQWIDAEADFTPEETPTEMYWTDALFTYDATNHTAMEIKISLPVFAKKIVIDVFDGNADSDKRGEGVRDDAVEIKSAANCPAFPAIIPRSSWCGGAAPCSSVNATYTVTYINPTHVVMHHGASPNTYTNGQDVVRSYWNYHVNSLGWVDIGYNYLIDKYGNFYQGRRNPNLPNQDVKGAHAGNANNGSIGVNFLGNLDVSIATTAQLTKLHQLLAWWFDYRAIDPLGSAGMQTQAYGWQIQPRFTYHNAIGQTSCPGTDMISRMPSIRQAVRDSIDACNVSNLDVTAPTTTTNIPYNWRSNDFWAEFDDIDNPGGTGIEESYYQVMEYVNNEWRGNEQNGFFNDNFNSSIHPSWTQASGTWSINNGRLNQSNQSITNSNIYTALTQNNQNTYLYHWQAYISGTGTNRRCGLHFFVDNPTLPNRGNSYLAWWRADSGNKFELYKVTNDVLSIVATNTSITVPVNQWFDCKVTYNPSNGLIEVFMNNTLIATYTDASPLQNGGFISLRNGDSDVMFDDLKVRLGRPNRAFVTIGSNTNKDIRIQSPTNTQEAGRINTITKDGANNWSAVNTKNIFVDWTAPSTGINVNGNWQTSDFIANYTDADNVNGSNIDRRFYSVNDFNGTERRANHQRGFFYDNFDALHSDWTVQTGTWTINNGILQQTDNAVNNSNIWAPLKQNLSNRYMYKFKMRIDGTGSNRRGGFHYFCSDPLQPNRGNSYFVWFRVELGTLEFYKVSGDTLNQEKVIPLTTVAGQWYDVTVVYDRITGETFVYRDNKLVGEWKDDFPFSNGDYISFRSGNSVLSIDSLRIYRTRLSQTNITIGTTADDVRYENPNPNTPSANIHSIAVDSAFNLSNEFILPVNIDWSVPTAITTINDGTTSDIDTVYTTNTLSANWTNSTDPNSNVVKYWVSIGTTPGATDVLGWTDVGNNTAYTASALTLVPNTVYYINVRAENGAGLLSNVITSDGQRVLAPLSVFENSENKDFAVYPNPIQNHLFVQFDAGKFAVGEIRLYDTKGSLILAEKLSSANTGIQTHTITLKQKLPTGVYSLQLISKDKTETINVIKGE